MKTNTKPPRKVINNLISRIRKLSKGKTIFVEVPEYGVVLNCDISWQSDNVAELEGWDLSPMKDTTEKEKKLISLIEDIYEVNHIFEKNIFKSQQYKEFNVEIKQLCRDFDKLKKQFKSLDWEEDILIPAENIKAKR